MDGRVAVTQHGSVANFVVTRADGRGAELTLKSGNLVLEGDGELVGDWAIEERRKGRR